MSPEVINEIRTSLASLQQQLDSFSTRLQELSEVLAAEEAAAVDPESAPVVAVEEDFPAEISDPAVMEEDPAPVFESLPEEPLIEEIPVEDVPVPEVEEVVMDIPEEFTPAEDFTDAPVFDAPVEESFPVIETPAEESVPEEESAQAEENPVEATPAEAAPAVREEAPAKIFTKEYRWLEDMPGGEVSNIISAISLNDRILFINTLFGKDPMLFNSTIAELNSLESLDVARTYLADRFPEWDLESDVVYRIMMAIRRKLK